MVNPNEASKDLRKILDEQVVLGDGAMGTLLYEQGVFVNRCFEEINITEPDKILKIHQAYVEVGVDFIETNTFGANKFKLGRFSMAEKTEQINTAAVEIAKKAAFENVLIAGSMGPSGTEIEPYGPTAKDEVAAAFKNQAQYLLKAGVDFILLETFANSEELIIALRALAEITDKPIVAQMTFDENNKSFYGKSIEEVISVISAEPNVTAVGMNCSVGPSAMLNTLDIVRNATDKPISVQPNAGLPKRVDNRTLYMCTPEYMAEFAKRFMEKGARIIGGCCGTTPSHVREIVRAIRTLDRATRSHKPVAIPVVVKDSKKAQPRPVIPLNEKSQLGRKIAQGKKVISIEITPPRGYDLNKTIEKARLCAELGADVINIPDGPRASCRMSPIATGIKIEQTAGIETIVHFCCRDKNLIGMQADILGAQALGLRNLLIITGDPPKLGEYPNATGVFDIDSVALCSVVRNLNQGFDIGGSTISPALSMTIGVGANPVAVDLEREIDKFEQKVMAGAEYAITQPVFDPEMLLSFIKAVKKFRIPIIAGIWPFTSYKNAEFMANEVPGVVVPDELLKRMSKTTTRQQGRTAGIEIAREIVEQIEDHVDGFAISAPFGNVKLALAVLDKIDITEAVA